MKAKSFIVALVAGFAAVMVAAVMATSARAGSTHPSVTIAADVVVTPTADDESTEPADDEVAENETWVCYSHFQDAPIAMSVSDFNFMTKADQPELGGKPYWTNGFIPFANQTAGNGQATGNGYYLHCNLAGPPVAPNVWVNSDGMPLTAGHYADWVAEFGGGATDPAGKPAAFNFYPVVVN